jgi:hypothetical protein
MTFSSGPWIMFSDFYCSKLKYVDQLRYPIRLQLDDDKLIVKMVTAAHEAMHANLMNFIKEELGRMGLRPSHHSVECDACGQGKVKRRIRRAPRGLDEGPGYRLAIDFHDFNRGYGGFNSLMLVTDRWSGYSWDYYLSDRKAKVAEVDNELTTRVG